MTAPQPRARRNWAWPWTRSSASIGHFMQIDVTDAAASQWRDDKIQELGVVNVTAALVAGVVSSAFSWPTIESAPWTAKAVFYSTLLLAISAIATGSQQSIALNRYGRQPDGLKELQDSIKGTQRGDARPSQLYVWQLPIMLLNISLALFVVGLVILIWAKAARSPRWDDDMKIAFVVTIAGLFCVFNYAIGASMLYRKRA
ncbi:hypothetical protein FB567DRAFT_284828 [Paraphoma chrysanthemicola]|uniref:Uncharacterized protein n=1 Tax=Paraphoma chrysanthemicola TaxID=798071 RepID=A0A8K0R9Y0_9PLEO|nr:hypothetical protein FB567DRAFT_284828 [Paraphoma chrysanthemicola]